VILVNAQHVKHVPGRKTDVKDSEWLCKLLRSGTGERKLHPSERNKGAEGPYPVQEETHSSHYLEKNRE